MKPPIYLHIGKPKCASTWLQKEVFPYSSHKYLGKPHNYDFMAKGTQDRTILNDFDYIILKILLAKGIKSISNEKLNFLSKLHSNEGILLSEELITCRVLYKMRLTIINHFGTLINEDDSYVLKKAFKYGSEMAKKKSLLDQCDTSRIIVDICKIFDRVPEKLIIVDRPFSEWIISLFSQFWWQNKINSNFRSGEVIDLKLFNRKALIGLVGFALGIEYKAFEKGYSLGISSKNVVSRISDCFPDLSITTIMHTSNSNEFIYRLKDICLDLNINRDLDELVLNSKKSNVSNKRESLPTEFNELKDSIDILSKKLLLKANYF